MVVDVGGCEVWKWFEKFGGLPCVQGAGEVLAGAEQSELLKLMISVVKHCVFAQVFLELAKQACCKAWLLFKVCGVKAPLVFEERV